MSTLSNRKKRIVSQLSALLKRLEFVNAEHCENVRLAVTEICWDERCWRFLICNILQMHKREKTHDSVLSKRFQYFTSKNVNNSTDASTIVRASWMYHNEEGKQWFSLGMIEKWIFRTSVFLVQVSWKLLMLDCKILYCGQFIKTHIATWLFTGHLHLHSFSLIRLTFMWVVDPKLLWRSWISEILEVLFVSLDGTVHGGSRSGHRYVMSLGPLVSQSTDC